MYDSPSQDDNPKLFKCGNHLALPVALVAGNIYALPVCSDCQRIYRAGISPLHAGGRIFFRAGRRGAVIKG